MFSVQPWMFETNKKYFISIVVSIEIFVDIYKNALIFLL